MKLKKGNSNKLWIIILVITNLVTLLILGNLVIKSQNYRLFAKEILDGPATSGGSTGSSSYKSGADSVVDGCARVGSTPQQCMDGCRRQYTSGVCADAVIRRYSGYNNVGRQIREPGSILINTFINIFRNKALGE